MIWRIILQQIGFLNKLYIISLVCDVSTWPPVICIWVPFLWEFLSDNLLWTFFCVLIKKLGVFFSIAFPWHVIGYQGIMKMNNILHQLVSSAMRCIMAGSLWSLIHVSRSYITQPIHKSLIFLVICCYHVEICLSGQTVLRFHVVIWLGGYTPWSPSL